jgi:hypothetical protein
MEEAMKETESSPATPEQLLQMLDAQLAARRSHRATSDRNRAIILVGGLLFIVGGAAAALLLLDQMLMDMRSGDRSSSAPMAQTEGKF